jgi:hypothetical protein
MWSQKSVDALSRDEAVEGGFQVGRLDLCVLRGQGMPAHSGPTRIAEQFVKLKLKVHCEVLRA